MASMALDSTTAIAYTKLSTLIAPHSFPESCFFGLGLTAGTSNCLMMVLKEMVFQIDYIVCQSRSQFDVHQQDRWSTRSFREPAAAGSSSCAEEDGCMCCSGVIEPTEDSLECGFVGPRQRQQSDVEYVDRLAFVNELGQGVI